MPLACDCYGGCWGVHSKDWPSIEVPAERIEKAKTVNPYYPEHVAAVRLCEEAGVPYGSYVTVKNVLRVENEDLLNLVKVFVNL